MVPKKPSFKKDIPAIAVAFLLMLPMGGVMMGAILDVSFLAGCALFTLFVLAVSAYLFRKNLKFMFVVYRRRNQERDFAAAQFASGSKGTVHVVGDVTVWTDVDDFDVKLLEDATRICLEKWTEILGLELPPPTPLRLLLFEAKEALDQYSRPWFDSRIAEGYYTEPPAARIVIRRGWTRRSLGSFVHELLHHLEYTNLGSFLPPWLREGIAEHVASEITQLPTSETAVGRFLSAARSREELFSGRELIRFDVDKFRASIDMSDAVALQRLVVFYAQSTLFVRYLLETDRTSFRELLKGSSLGVADIEKDFAQRFGVSFDEAMGRYINIEIGSLSESPLAPPPAHWRAFLEDEVAPRALDRLSTPFTRFTAIGHLGPGGWVWAAGALIDALDDPSPLCRNAARWALENLAGGLMGDDSKQWDLWLETLPPESVCWKLVSSRSESP